MHVFALGLAPGEEVTLEQKTFSKRQTTFERQDEQEDQFELELSSSLTTELAEGFEEQKNRSESTGLSFSHTGQFATPDYFWGKINASHTGSTTHNVTGASQTTTRRSAKDSYGSSSKVAAKYRAQHKTTFKVSEERGFESSSKRVIRNPNRHTRVTLHYFKVLERLELQQERYGVRLCWSPAVRDPAARFFEQLQAGRKRILDAAQASVPEPPKDPATVTTGQAATVTVSSDLTDAGIWELTQWQIRDYAVEIALGSDHVWNGQAADVTLKVENERAANNFSVTVKGAPVLRTSGGNTWLRVVVHVNAQSSPWLRYMPIQFQVSAKCTLLSAATLTAAEKAAAVAQHAIAREKWEAKRETILEAAAEEAAAWEAGMRERLDPLKEMISQITATSLRDELWEIDFWQELFDWDQASHVAHPGWWSESGLRDPSKDAADFINASCAKLYLPVRPGMERLALRWIFGRTIDRPLESATEHSFDALLDDLPGRCLRGARRDARGR